LETLEDGAAQLTPMASKNPIQMGDRALSGPTRLENGDSFRIGKFKLTWHHESCMDVYALHELAELPRFHRKTSSAQEETYAVSPEMHQRLARLDELREKAVLRLEEGPAYRLGVEPVDVGPEAAVPCASRWGRWVAARITWAGIGHTVERTGLFSVLKLNGEVVPERCLLEPGCRIEVNGTRFDYLIPGGGA